MRFLPVPVAVCCLSVFPAPVSSQDMPVTQVLIDGEDWETVAEGYGFTEGPAVDAAGNVFFSDPKNHRIYRAGIDGKVTLFAEHTQKTSGLMFGPDGRLYGCSRDGRRIAVWNTDGAAETVVEVDDCNDLVVGSDGSIYFTDPKNQRVYHVSPDRRKRVVAEGFTPNGIILWPKEGTLVVTDRSEPHLWTFRIESDGSLSSRERYYMPLQLDRNRDRPGSDGMTVDSRNRLYVATHVGIQMFDPTGRLGGTILKPQRRFLSNITFGGPGFSYLYATCTDKVYRRRVKPVGAPYFQRAE